MFKNTKVGRLGMQPETFTELSTRQTDGLNSRGWIYLRGSSWSVDKNLELTLSPTPPPELWSGPCVTFSLTVNVVLHMPLVLGILRNSKHKVGPFVQGYGRYGNTSYFLEFFCEPPRVQTHYPETASHFK